MHPDEQLEYAATSEYIGLNLNGISWLIRYVVLSFNFLGGVLRFKLLLFHSSLSYVD